MNAKHTHLTAATAVATFLTTVVAACSSASSADPAIEPPSAGAESTLPAAGEPITLTLGTDDSPGVPSADQILQFADAVERLSDGAVVIEPVWHAAGLGLPDWDQAVARMVQSGELDMALGPTWAWDVLEVDSFEPLQSPFLVDSDELVAAIVTDEELSVQLMSGMPEVGVHGISMWPEGLRHPFGFEAPLVALDDYDGQVIRSALSNASTALFEALGATTSPDAPNAVTMAGTQAELVLSPNGIGAANVTFFPKVSVLYANADVYADLDAATLEILDEAAEATQEWAIERADDVAAGASFCADGGVLVDASADELSALQRTTSPVADRIAAAHPDVVDAIRGLKEGLPAPRTAQPCGPSVGTESEQIATAATSQLNGVYRYTVTKEEILAFEPGAAWVDIAAGVQNYTLQDGELTWRVDPSERAEVPEDTLHGTYEVSGDVITVRFPTDNNELTKLRFEVAPDGDLHMTLLETNTEWSPVSGSEGIDFYYTNKPWDKVG